MGGPRRFSEKFGPINIPQAHGHLKVTDSERDMWLDCMAQALSQQPYPDSLRSYLRAQLAIPAQRIVARSQANHSTGQTVRR